MRLHGQFQAERKTWFKDKWIAQGGGFTIVKSTDEGQTWSAPIPASGITS